MKPCRLFATTVSALVLSAGPLARGQEALPVLPEAPEIEEITLAVQEQVEAAVEHAEQLARQAEEQLELANVQQDILLAQAAAGAAPSATPVAPMPAVQQRLQKIVARGRPNAGKTLVIRSSDTDPKTQANMEEDLNVMSRILDKAVAQQFDDDRHPRAMGIDVFMTPGSGSMRSLYLEGYGAVFMLNVGFPLLAPPEKPEEAKEKPETNTTWEEAKREVYGRGPGVGEYVDMALRIGEHGWAPQEYDEKKVQRLKDALLDALKNGTNIRNLKSDESITVCVFGGSRPARAAALKRHAAVAKSGRSPDDHNLANALVWQAEESAQSHGTIMTIRVKKSDVDAFGKGRLDADDFRKKASILTYAGDTGGWGGAGGWFGLAP